MIAIRSTFRVEHGQVTEVLDARAPRAAAVRTAVDRTHDYRCSSCGQRGHSARTCSVDELAECRAARKERMR